MAAGRCRGDQFISRQNEAERREQGAASAGTAGWRRPVVSNRRAAAAPRQGMLLPRGLLSNSEGRAKQDWRDDAISAA